MTDGWHTPGTGEVETFKTDYNSRTIDNSILVMAHCKYLPSNTMRGTMVLCWTWFVKASLRSLAPGPGIILVWVSWYPGHDGWSPGEPLLTSGTWWGGVTQCHSSLRCSLTLLRRHSSSQIRVSCYNLELGLAIPSLITLGLIFLSARVYVYDAQ